MILVPFLVLALLACGGWSWWYQRRVLQFLRSRPSHARRSDAPVTARPAPPSIAPAAPQMAPVRVAVQQRQAAAPPPPPSVLGWEAFSVVSTLVLDGQAMLTCRRRPDSQGRKATTPAEQATLVLLIGQDEGAARAVALLERWRAVKAPLHVRPTTVAGGIELFDSRSNALRAHLLAA